MIDMASLILFYRGGRELLISGISLEDAKRFSRSDKTVNKKRGGLWGSRKAILRNFPRTKTPKNTYWICGSQEISDNHKL